MGLIKSLLNIENKSQNYYLTQKINLDTTTEEQLKTLLPTDRLKSMFYELRKYANMETGLYEITQYMKRKKFNFATNKVGMGRVQYFVTDIGGERYIFEY